MDYKNTTLALCTDLNSQSNFTSIVRASFTFSESAVYRCHFYANKLLQAAHIYPVCTF